MKAEHVSAIVGFLRRMRPADLILPAGAALVSVGLQQLVDREERQRRRIAALQQLLEEHAGALVDAGVSLPADLLDDEQHPLDVEGALQIVLARTPAEPDYRIAGNANPEKRPRRRRRYLAAAAIVAGAAAAVMIPRPGFLQALSLTGLVPTGGWPPAVDEDAPPVDDSPFGPISSNSYPVPDEWPGDRCTTCERAVVWFRDEQVWRHVSPGSGEPYAMLHDVTLPAAVNESNAPADDPEGVIGRGNAPLEECGWKGCDWSSDATRSELSQQTAAAVHRNRCVYRPAGAQVPEV